MKYTCPACGFPDLDEPPWSDTAGPSLEICICCGIQFGYDDACGDDPDNRQTFYAEWRDTWIANNMPWFSVETVPPLNWDPVKQLQLLGIQVSKK